jgi:imidazole glycerol-phosphate synthase subunit HisH
MKVALFDYGVGNLHSLRKAIEQSGAEVIVAPDLGQALESNALVLPGVGAFGAAASTLAPVAPALRAALASGFPCLGICLGMQLLFDSSEEGFAMGLGAVRGQVRRLRAKRVPHMGWNLVEPSGSDPLFNGIDAMPAYYANSFIAEPSNPDEIVAWTEYDGERFAAAVHRDRTWGVQFHPEKSGPAGLQLIGNFLAQVNA